MKKNLKNKYKKWLLFAYHIESWFTYSNHFYIYPYICSLLHFFIHIFRYRLFIPSFFHSFIHLLFQSFILIHSAFICSFVHSFIVHLSPFTFNISSALKITLPKSNPASSRWHGVHGVCAVSKNIMKHWEKWYLPMF